MKIRIATIGWNGGQAAETADEVQVGFRVPWIELDGHRISDIVSVSFKVSNDDFTTPQAVVDLIGAIEIVYVDKDGVELKTEERSLESLPDKIDCDTVIEAQGAEA